MTADDEGGRRGWSEEAWTAISAIADALVTAAVSLATHCWPRGAATYEPRARAGLARR